MAQLKLLGISGSLRKDATNSMLLREAARLFGDCEYTHANIDFPLYDGDNEEADGVPEVVQVLARQIADADAVIISTPEYNKGPSGALKNALDWVSRTKDKPWAGKPVAIMSATAGRSGGERAQNSLRLCLQPFAPRLLNGPEVLVGHAQSAFEDGVLIDARYKAALTALMRALKESASSR